MYRVLLYWPLRGVEVEKNKSRNNSRRTKCVAALCLAASPSALTSRTMGILSPQKQREFPSVANFANTGLSLMEPYVASSVRELLTRMLWSPTMGDLAESETEFAGEVSLPRGGLKKRSCRVVAKGTEYCFSLKKRNKDGWIYTVEENGNPVLCYDLAARHNDWLFLFARHRAAEAMLAYK